MTPIDITPADELPHVGAYPKLKQPTVIETEGEAAWACWDDAVAELDPVADRRALALALEAV